MPDSAFPYVSLTEAASLLGLTRSGAWRALRMAQVSPALRRAGADFYRRGDVQRLADHRAGTHSPLS